MSIQSVRKVFQESMKAAPMTNKYLSGAEASKVLAEASKNGVTAGEVAFIKRALENGVLQAGSFTEALPELHGDAFYMAKATEAKLESFIAKHDRGGPRPINLGELEKPGASLKGKTIGLLPGQTLTFKTRENQIWNLGDIKVSPPDALIVTRKILQRPPDGMLGGTSLVEYSFKLNPARLPGTQTFSVTTRGSHQVRNDPNWAFSFKINDAARRPVFTLAIGEGQQG